MSRAGADQVRARRPPAHPSQFVQTGVGAAEVGIYVVVAALLVVAVTFTMVDTVKHVIEAGGGRSSDFVAQIGALSGLAIAFTLAIYLFRRSERRDEV